MISFIDVDYIEGITGDDARDFFKKRGLTYTNISKLDIDMLKCMVEVQLLEHARRGGLEMHLNAPLCDACYTLHDDWFCLDRAYLRVRSSDFENREAISFNHDGFIGFAGWASSENVHPFLVAFINWVTVWVDAK